MSAAKTPRRIIQPEGLNRWNSLDHGYAEALLVGNRLIMSGQVSLAETFEEQASEILGKIRRIVALAGGSMDDIVDITIYSVIPHNWGELRPLLIAALEGNYPCVTLVGVPHLSHPDMLLEIKAEAVID
jgi:2-iminobutanoate/2-iminopropanoate deaminase